VRDDVPVELQECDGEREFEPHHAPVSLASYRERERIVVTV